MATLHSLNTPAQHPTITLVDSSGNVFFPASSSIPGSSTVAEPLDPDRLTVGEATMRRRDVSSNSVATGSGTMRLGYFTARKTETVTQVRIASGTTAAGATPSLARIGVHSVAANGDITLIASTANDTTLFAAASTAYTRALTAPFNKVAGQRYAVGILFVTGATAPTTLGNGVLPATENGTAPRLSAFITGLADLPASALAAATLDTGLVPYAVLLP